MKRFNLRYSAWLFILAFLAVGCEKEVEKGSFTFNATIEGLESPSNDTKTYLLAEQFVYWELGDKISLGSDASGSTLYNGVLVNASGADWADFNGVFITEMPYGSQYFAGLFPHSENNVIEYTSDKNFNLRIDLPAEQPLHNRREPDHTFGKNVFPMVAWYGGHWDDQPGSEAYNLDFHSLAGIARLQFLNGTGVEQHIDYIDVTSPDMQLKGMFNVQGYRTAQPYLSSLSSAAADRTVRLTCPDNRVFGADSVYSFYLVLPALGTNTVTTSYHLELTLHTTEGNACTKKLTVPVRRTSIAPLRALEITAWTPAAATPRIVGNGTAERPFKIYTTEDMVYLRECYNEDTVAPNRRRINGIPITNNTHIRIMRNDISLTPVNWPGGLKNFRGHFTDMAQSSSSGINNQSGFPIFETVLPGAVVEGLRVKAEGTNNYNVPAGVTPLCAVNQGTLRGCEVANVTSGGCISSTYSSVVGVCAVNDGGLIDGCRCVANLDALAAGTYTAGICLSNINGGTITGCHVTSMSTPGPNATYYAGICYSNSANSVVRDSYFATAFRDLSCHVAGIVFENSGVVQHCSLSSATSIWTSGTVGGIVHTNSGIVDYCYSMASLSGSSVGAIVDSNLANGHIINCYVDDINSFLTVPSTGTAIGGIAAVMTGGTITNSYVHNATFQRTNNSIPMGAIVGNDVDGVVNNCYSYVGNADFYGAVTGGDASRFVNCYSVESASQTYIVSETSSDASYSGGLTATLNSNRASLTLPSGIRSRNSSRPSGVPAAISAAEWQLSGSAPTLVTYSYGSK